MKEEKYTRVCSHQEPVEFRGTCNINFISTVKMLRALERVHEGEGTMDKQTD